MSRKSLNTKEEFESIINTLKQFKEGASIDQIKKGSGLEIATRTLQRRLGNLQKQGLIRSSGKTSDTLYFLIEIKKETKSTESKHDLLPLSDESKELLSLIRSPEEQRTPVGYNREFLMSYRPNTDSYLTKKEKENLENIGKTARLDQPAGTYAKEILHRLLIDLSWNSSRLEGNTYSLLDTERLVFLGQAAGDKTAAEAQMILNHKEAIEFTVQGDGIGFNRYTILNLHALLSNNLLADPEAPGRLRKFGVGIQKSVYTPLGIPQQIEEMFELTLEKAQQIQDPFEQALFIMIQLPYLQPFDDVNKRVSRIAANIPFNQRNFVPLSFTGVPNDMYINGLLAVYELNRIELMKDVFLWAYERSSAKYAALRQSLGEPDPFRLKYREEMQALITDVVSNSLSHKEASDEIKQKTSKIPENDKTKFIEYVETELMSLHEGNFARYWISPSEFKRWKEVWSKE